MAATALARPPATSLVAPRYNPKQMDLIRRTVAKGTSPEQFDLFMEVCRRSGLDPFRRQIYAVVRMTKDPDDTTFEDEGRQQRKVATMTVQTGIDGYRAIAARNRDYRPDDHPPRFTLNPELIDQHRNPLGIECVEVTPYKMDAGGNWHPIVGLVFWEEYVPLKEIWERPEGGGSRRPSGKFRITSDFWKRMGRNQLAKCAEAAALRKGWPDDLSGIYVDAELEQAGELIDVTPSEAVEAHLAEQRLARIGHGPGTIPISWAVDQAIEMVPAGQVFDRVCAWLEEQDSPSAVAAFGQRNAEPLKVFWAVAKGDALELRERVQERMAVLANGQQGERERQPETAAPASAAPREEQRDRLL